MEFLAKQTFKSGGNTYMAGLIYSKDQLLTRLIDQWLTEDKIEIVTEPRARVSGHGEVR